MTTDRKKPGVAFWATVALAVVLVGYPLSQGPAGWLITREWSQEWMMSAYLGFYWPLLSVLVRLATSSTHPLAGTSGSGTASSPESPVTSPSQTFRRDQRALRPMRM